MGIMVDRNYGRWQLWQMGIMGDENNDKWEL